MTSHATLRREVLKAQTVFPMGSVPPATAAFADSKGQAAAFTKLLGL